MELFVLLGQVDYEGQALLGVYSSQSLAVHARDVLVASDPHLYFDSYVVQPLSLDVAAAL